MDFKPSDSDQSRRFAEIIFSFRFLLIVFRVTAVIIVSCICCSITVIAIVIPIVNLYSPKPYASFSPGNINNQSKFALMNNESKHDLEKKNR